MWHLCFALFQLCLADFLVCLLFSAETNVDCLSTSLQMQLLSYKPFSTVCVETMWSVRSHDALILFCEDSLMSRETVKADIHCVPVCVYNVLSLFKIGSS